MMIVAVLNSGCGDGAVTGAHEVETTSQRNWPATEPDRDGAVGESEHAIAATSANTPSSTRTITSVDTGARVYGWLFRCRASNDGARAEQLGDVGLIVRNP